MLMVAHLIWVVWVIKPQPLKGRMKSIKANILFQTQYKIQSPASNFGAGFFIQTFLLTSKMFVMEKRIIKQLSEWWKRIKDFMRGNKRNDDDYFDHPFAIF